MFNLIRRFLQPTLRGQLEDGVRSALKRYTDRRTAPDLRVYVSTDLLPEGVDPTRWREDETAHLRGFAAQWAQDNNIARAGIRLEVILLDTKREFAFVKPVGLEPPEEAVRPSAAAPLVSRGPEAAGGARLEVVGAGGEPLVVRGEMVVGRREEPGVTGLGDRYMSAQHARFHLQGDRLWVTDLDSKNRTLVNGEAIAPHQPKELRMGDTVRMGSTELRVGQVEG